MRKVTLFFALLLLTVMPAGAVFAQVDATQGAPGMARYMPGDTDIFAAFRTDDAYIGELDGVYQRVLTALPEAARAEMPGSLIESIDTSMTNEGSYEEVREWLGDYAALSLGNLVVTMDDDPGNDSEVEFLFLLEISNADAFKTYFEDIVMIDSDEFVKSEEADYTLYSDPAESAYLAVSDNLAILTNNPEMIAFEQAAPLVNDSSYQQSFTTLPESSYNIVFYLDYNALLGGIMTQPGQADMFAAMGVDLQNIRSMVMGFTILDGRSFAMDIGVDADYDALGVDLSAFSSIDPAFEKFIPADTEVIIRATDMSTNYITQTDQFSTMMQEMDPGSADPFEQVEGTLAAFTGINLREDILSWTTGDYAIAMDVNFDAFVALLGGMETGNDPMAMLDPSPLGLALLIEATDPALAADATAKIVGAVERFTGGEESISIAPDTVGGHDATIIGFTVPMEGQPFTLELVIGSNNEVFFFGTKDYIESALTGGGLAEDAEYQDASQYFLSDASTLIYTDDDGLLASFAVPALVFVGPAIGNVFDSIAEDLNASAPDSSRMMVQNDPTAEAREALDAYRGLIASSSITASYTNGTTIRLVITLE
ncbi:MAG: DUF3352 domain-containing protein [Aggregatilineales bacterium]